MILGIGVDIIEVSRIKASIEKFGDRFLQRILHVREIEYCHCFSDPAPHAAARFAAKEAISKAFGTGIGAQLSWRDMEVGRHESGEPYVILYGRGESLFKARGGERFLLSLSHTRDYAVAMAVWEGETASS
ncbi:MAG: holo-ACP synthase [Verrucomicrobia bacterium]|nr:holo-ACP synthase [Verrucomicrobiota bacterium]MCF7708793.1 holo-ACP synthase [Verrucomicrobiota bacterium]